MIEVILCVAVGVVVGLELSKVVQVVKTKVALVLSKIEDPTVLS